MKPRGMSPLVDQQQVPVMQNRGGRDSVKSWAERSVWSLVCAMELGLISEPCPTSVSFGSLTNDGSLARTGTPIGKEFTALNTPGNRRAREFAATSRRPASNKRIATTKRDVRELARARNSTVSSFWKSCKRKVGRPRKRLPRNYQDPELDDIPFESSIELFSGIGRRACGISGPRETNVSSSRSSLFRARRNGFVERGSRHVTTEVSKRCATMKKQQRKRTARIVENVDASKILRSCAVSRKEKVFAESSINVRWEYREHDPCPSRNDSLEDKRRSMINDHGYGHSRSSNDPREDACEDSRSSSTGFEPEDRGTVFDDVHTLPLAERISTGSPENDDNDLSAMSNDEKDFRTRSSDDLVSIVGETTIDVGCEDDDDVVTLVEEPIESNHTNSFSLQNREETSSEENVPTIGDNDPRCRSSDGDSNDEKQTSTMKRNKINTNGSVIGTTVRPAAKCDTLRAKIFRNDDEYHDIRRVTRGSTRISKENFVGKLVWGCCSGWWPALIIDADHVGMLSEAGKLWVYWIGEARISLLNEKTQIESFSCNLKYRLAQNLNVARILRTRLGCTLTKPYSAWIESNFSEEIEMLDEIKFYPYPNRIQQRLDSLKEKNSKVTEKYLLDQKRETQGKKVIERPKESPQQNDADGTRLPLKEQHPGVITWAKIAGHNWWPAMIIDYRDCCMREPGFGCQWIMWYGDYKLSEVHHQSFLRFDKGVEKLRDYINNTKKHAYLVGVLQASKDYCSRLGCETDNWTLAAVFKRFSKMNRPQPQPDPPKKGDSVKIYDKYSAHIVKKLNELKNNPNIDDQRADDIKNSDDLRSVISGRISLDTLCLKCLKTRDEAMEAHPFLEGSLCKDCSEQYKPRMFVFGNDAKCFYCTVCAGSGTVIICDNEDCPRVYCTACMKHLLCPRTYDEVLLEDPWECFLCQSRSSGSSDTIVRPRANWKDKIIDMFRTRCNSSAPVAEHLDKRRRIRVLSLFDGLSTGLLVLLKLGLVVDVYYASEIDPDALMVSASHFGDRIVHLGDVMDITREKIKEMTPIDLLIGGSPCNDLSLANPARLGLYDPKGTGVLFFEYCRIMKLVKKMNNRRPLFWMYENVASMPTEYRLEMNKHLGQEPDVIDSADFSPQHRLRLYWHNLPIEPHSLSSQGEQDVQDILTPHCQRYALVKKIRTVTTKVNSLKQGKLALKPILMKDESDSLWITELEEIFGFPRHYTDVKNLSATKRQRLIGKSWSVQTLSAILRSLCPYFECNTTETNPAFSTRVNVHRLTEKTKSSDA
ncbi:DNA methyltransferase 3 isoform X2 [Ptiloglossa arizonensis]|uniref:DNA methyltransferase 3 isoform X2 n=1 Tax=Ptiloglossa arizonensis TaxID=3350558 RepID=UPI003F9FAB5B